MPEPSNTDLALALYTRGVAWFPKLSLDEVPECVLVQVTEKALPYIAWAAAVALVGRGYILGHDKHNPTWTAPTGRLFDDPDPIHATLLAACAMEGIDVA